MASHDPGNLPASLPPASESGTHPFAAKVVRFEELARCGEELWIECEGQLYRLRKTRHGKLVLTK